MNRAAFIAAAFLSSACLAAPVQIPAPTAQPVRSPDGLWTMQERRTGVDELWSIGTGPPQRINCPMTQGGNVTLRYLGKPVYSVSADSRAVIYVGDAEVDGRFDLFVSPVSGCREAIFIDGFESGNFAGWN